MTHRFFISPAWIESPLVKLQGNTARQIRKVLRLRPGEDIIVLDNSGREWLVRLIEVNKASVQGQIIQEQQAQGEPVLQLTLYQAALKAQKFEWVLQKGTELGISRFVPTVSRRSVVGKLDALTNKQERWQRIIQEAAEQSGRAVLPRLEPALLFDDALRHAYAASLRLMLWEDASDTNLKAALTGTKSKNVALFVGPEGGFTAEEAASARQLGFRVVKLGPRILRAETAGLAACAAIFYEGGEWD